MIISTLASGVPKYPNYDIWYTDWVKWRLTYEGGRNFINSYLQKYSNRESNADFCSRKEITYCPAFAKAAINDIKNSIFQRMVDITRTGGPKNYLAAINGLNGGIDGKGSSLNNFIGLEILPELLVMGRVGVFVDAPPKISDSLLDKQQPYIYIYEVENICSWACDKSGNIVNLLVRDYSYVYDENTNLPTSLKCSYRHFYIENGRVEYEIYDEKYNNVETVRTDLTQIPFVMIELSASLMTDIADYQIAMLNIASSDIAFILKGNFPFYVEQYDPVAENGFGKVYGEAGTGNSDEKTQNEINVGGNAGRRYPKSVEAPQFINPSPEPLDASIRKQELLKQEIRLLINLSVSNLAPPKLASAERLVKEEGTLESGLSYIGLTLEGAERKIAEYWAMYLGEKDITTIKYPTRYSIRTSDEQYKEVDNLKEILPTIPSLTYKKVVAKKIVSLTVSNKITDNDLEIIEKEIDNAQIIVSAEQVQKDIELGIVSRDFGSTVLGYPEGEAEKANKEYAERATIMASAQNNQDNMVDPSGQRKTEKKVSQNPDKNPEGIPAVRGEGK